VAGDPRCWLAALALPPLLVIGASLLRLEVERLRRLAVVAAGAATLLALAVGVSPAVRGVWLRTDLLTALPGGEALVRVDALAAALLPFAAGLWLLTVAVTPRALLDRDALRRTAVAALITLASFVTESAVALLLLSVAGVWAFLAALGTPGQRHQRRVVAAYLGVSTVLFALGVALLVGPGGGHPLQRTASLWLIGIAALVRKGIVPFHAWVPEVFDHGRMGPAILFNAPQVGAYMTVVLIVPRASPELLHTIAILALGTAVYGAALALVQTSARRACGYLFVSQSALVMAGLDCTSAGALAGGLVVWLSAGLAFAGLARSVLVLEARRGRLDLGRYHGGYERMPVLAVSFLAMGLACTGFPGTLGFVGQELLVNGAVDAFPVLGFSVVAASALTGLAVVRMYFSLFCGRPDPLAHSAFRFELKPREVWSFVGLLVVLVGLGVVPRPLVDSRFKASDDILRQRREYTGAAPGRTGRWELTTDAHRASSTRLRPDDRATRRPRSASSRHCSQVMPGARAAMPAQKVVLNWPPSAVRWPWAANF
jgi:NADH-quinone oxidoreductase subunit M